MALGGVGTLRPLILSLISLGCLAQTSIRVNVGGPTFVDHLGLTWDADNGCTSASTYTRAESISGTSDPTLYQTGRTDPSAVTCQYTITTPGFYTVALRFAETDSTITATNKRIFNIFINGRNLGPSTNVRDFSGFAVAFDAGYGPIPVYNTPITITIATVSGQPMLSAIDIEFFSAIAPNTCANLGTPTNGTVYYCTDCTFGSDPCTCGGTGSFADRVDGRWVCGGLTPSSTAVLTNKTIDAEATGNVITIPFVAIYKAGVCQGAAAFLGFSHFTADGATASCVTGSNTQYAVAQFPDGASTTAVQDRFTLPNDWTGVIDVTGMWRTSVTSGNVVWQLQTACVAGGETGDPAFNSASTVTEAAQGSANQFNDFSMNSITITGCGANEEFFFRFFRDPTHGSDTLAGTAELISLTFKIRRAM